MRRVAAILGGGVIGGGWAARFLLNGWDVRVFDPDPEARRKIAAVLDNARHALPMLYDRALPDEGTLTFCASIAEAARGAAWIQESVPERLDLKHGVFQEVMAHSSGDVILGSSTSGFTPTQLHGDLADPGRILVAHPFNPVYLLPLVDLVGNAKNDPQVIEIASEILRSIGMYPLRVRAEIEAHIADRLLESVWREALWLVRDDVATTEEIDDAIRYGFGLRWAQMGLFETYRIAGGEAGMAHFMAQFGPCLDWPWSRLTDVPDLTDDLVRKIADQSDAQSGHVSIRALERRRDDTLVAMMRAQRQQGAAAGRLIAAHEETLSPVQGPDDDRVSVRRVVPVDWTDYNGHMNESRYGQVFSDAADALLARAGAGPDYVAQGNSFFTAETSIRYLAETLAGERIWATSRVILADGKKLRLLHALRREADGKTLATCEQFLLHVSLASRKSCAPHADVADALERLARRDAEA